MKKIYSLVLMAAVLLIGTNAWAVTRTAASASELETAWKAAENGDVIQLTNDFALAHTLWLGTINMNDAAKSITLDLNGHALSAAAGTVAKMFILSHGELNVISSQGSGQIIQTGTDAQSTDSQYEIFRVMGSTYKNVNAKTAQSGFFSHLVIAENVKLTANTNAIVVDRMDGWKSSAIATKGITTPSSKPYDTNVYSDGRGLANGARVDVYGTVHANKYGIKANGNMGSPATAATAGKAAHYYEDPEETITYVIKESDVDYAPFIYVHNTAEIKTLKPSSTAAIATYSGGYSRWQIEGYCEGSTGVYVKSGEVVVEDAIIKSNYTGTYKPSEGDRTSGVDAGGSGIAIASSKSYAGNIDVTVQGDSKVSGSTGYAIDEAVVLESGVTKVDGITITGGTFETGANGQGAIKISEPTAAANVDQNQKTEITIAGGQAEASITLGNPENQHSLNEVVKPVEGQSSVHVTLVDNGNGGTTMVISQGDAPSIAETKTSWSDIANFDDGSDANWTGKGDVDGVGVIASGSTVELGELLINAATATEKQELTIQNNATLIVDHLMMNAYAQIIVEAGGKFIVKGEQGIVAPKSSNIVLKTSEATPSYFLFNPAVTSNRHPHATVQLISKSWRTDAEHYQWERFGIPSWQGLESIESSVSYTNIQIAENGAWKDLGMLQKDVPFANIAELKKPFVACNLLSYKLTPGGVYTFKGELVGNINAELNANLEWNPFSNSYTADVDMAAILAGFAGAQYMDPTVYLATPMGNGHYAWDAVDAEWYIDKKQTKIAPMQAFILHNSGSFGEVATLNYNNMVWTPATAPAVAAGAPARSNDNTARLRVIVANDDNVSDDVKMTESAVNTHNAAKYMNDDVNIYAMADQKYAIVASEDLEDTYFGFSTVNGGNFTISFANVEGREFDLIDLETGAKVAVMEGESYNFTAAANTVADYRFKLVSRDNAPTAIENTEAVKSAKGIYTITGQYVGEMNVWNTLPAGVYVVNGEKLVK